MRFHRMLPVGIRPAKISTFRDDLERVALIGAATVRERLAGTYQTVFEKPWT